jgi:hypothetical protein
VSSTTEDEAVAGDAGAEDEARVYLAQVMAEIDEEVRARRASGDLPARVERELDALFLQFSPVAGRRGSMAEILRMVDASAYIDPVVPVGSAKSGGAVVKKGVRQLSLWYMSWITAQVGQFSASVSRALHVIDEQLHDLGRQLEDQRVPTAPVIDLPWAHGPGSWWATTVPDLVAAAPGRVLHAACGDGWLVRELVGDGLDAYGTDPRPGRADRAETDGTDLRDEPLVDHLEATASAGLGAIVVSGLVEAMAPGERDRLIDLVDDRLAPGGILVVHSLSLSAWAADEVPPEVDLAPGRPLRPATWTALLGARGYEVTVTPGPEGRDYLVAAVVPANR